MSTIGDIEEVVQQLPPKGLAKFREWFAEFDSEQWDRQIERDVAAGRLDALTEEALTDLREGAAGICETPREPTLLAVR